MRSAFFATIGGMLWVGAAAACPDPNASGLARYSADRQTLGRGISFEVTAGGASNLNSCAAPSGSESGFFITPPHLELFLDDVAQASIFVSTSTQGACDPVILVRGVTNEWNWDDNSRGLDARVTVQAEIDGVLDIWVGSADGAPCDTRVFVRTINPDRPEPAQSDNDGRGGSGGGSGSGAGGGGGGGDGGGDGGGGSDDFT